MRGENNKGREEGGREWEVREIVTLLNDYGIIPYKYRNEILSSHAGWLWI